MFGGYLVFCSLAPFALLGLCLMIELRVDLAQRCFQELARLRRTPGTRWAGIPWRLVGLAVANILIPLLASFFGMAALTSQLDWLVFVSWGLHGLNVAQGVLGLWLLARVLGRPRPGRSLLQGR